MSKNLNSQQWQNGYHGQKVVRKQLYLCIRSQLPQIQAIALQLKKKLQNERQNCDILFIRRFNIWLNKNFDLVTGYNKDNVLNFTSPILRDNIYFFLLSPLHSFIIFAIISMAKVNENYVPFKTLYYFEQRREKSKNMLQSFLSKGKANVVLLIIEPHPKSKLQIIDNCKLCCQADRPLSYLRQQLVNKKLLLTKNTSLFLYTGKVLLMGDHTIGQIKNLYGDEDGFLYINYSEMDVY